MGEVNYNYLQATQLVTAREQHGRENSAKILEARGSAYLKPKLDVLSPSA